MNTALICSDWIVSLCSALRSSALLSRGASRAATSKFRPAFTKAAFAFPFCCSPGLQKPCRGVVMSNLSIKFKSSASGNACDLSVSGKIDGFYEVSYVGSELMFQLFAIPLLMELIDK